MLCISLSFIVFISMNKRDPIIINCKFVNFRIISVNLSRCFKSHFSKWLTILLILVNVSSGIVVIYILSIKIILVLFTSHMLCFIGRSITTATFTTKFFVCFLFYCFFIILIIFFTSYVTVSSN